MTKTAEEWKSILQEWTYLSDVVLKYVVLLSFTRYIYYCIQYYLATKEVVNLPDWIVSLFTMVFLYFFRRAPERREKNGP